MCHIRVEFLSSSGIRDFAQHFPVCYLDNHLWQDIKARPVNSFDEFV
jgi:hypothetical protein